MNFYNGTTYLGSANLDSSGVATFSTTSLPVGTASITAAYTGNGTFKTSTSNVVTVTVIEPFTLSPSPSTISIIAGHTGVATIAVTPANGFNQALTFSCSGLPAGAICTFTPNATTQLSVSLSIATTFSTATGNSTVTVLASTGGSNPTSNTTQIPLTVTATDQSFSLKSSTSTIAVVQGQPGSATITMTPTTTRATGQLRLPLGRGSPIFYAALLPGLLGIVFSAGSRKHGTRCMRLLGLLVVLGFSTLWLGACGNNSTVKDPGTARGNYTITVNATSGGTTPVTGSTTVGLQVN